MWGEGMEGKRSGRTEGNGKREQESEREVGEDGIRETGQRTGWTAIRAPSSPLCTPMSFVLLCTPSWCFPKELLPPPRDLGAPCFA